jgi:endonuclease/exonuclease/phosphatase family metal-dependent hydrolase
MSTNIAATRVVVLFALLSLHSSLLSPRCGAVESAKAYLAKPDVARQVRVLDCNVKRGFPGDPSATDAFARILRATHPDVVTLQDVAADLGDGEPGVARRLLKDEFEKVFPGETWTVWVGKAGGYGRNVIATHYSLKMQREDTTPSSGIRGVTTALVNLPDESFGSTDLYLLCVHMKAGSEAVSSGASLQRQKHADAIANWILDARTPASEQGPWKNEINLPPNTPVVVVGDFNVCSHEDIVRAKYHPMRTLLQGDIVDGNTYGPGALPDWDGTALADALPRDPETGDCHTWSSAAKPSKRFSRFVYSDSVLRVARSVILNTRTMPPNALREAGLRSGDTADASEHLPCFVDFELAPDPPIRPVAARRSPMPALGDASSTAGLASRILTQTQKAQLNGRDVDTGPSLPSLPTPSTTE